jgi:hypothetical protein
MKYDRAVKLLRIAPLVLLVGCFEVSGGPTVSEECAANASPEIDNLELNSWLDEASGLWAMCIHFDWWDGVEGGAPPNMFGGYISTEIGGTRAESFWLDDKVIQVGAPAGSINMIFCKEEFAADGFIDFEFRVRDACNAVSNEKSGEYCLGQGICDFELEPNPHVLEHPEIGGDGCLAGLEIWSPCQPEEEPPVEE